MCSLLAPEKSSRDAHSRAWLTLGFKTGNELLERHRSEILAATGAHGHLVSRLLLLADNEEVRQLLKAMFANFIVYFLVPQVGIGAETRVSRGLGDFPGIVPLALGDIEHHGLLRSEPQRECPGV